jgi:hypothetical protein
MPAIEESDPSNFEVNLNDVMTGQHFDEHRHAESFTLSLSLSALSVER